MKICFEVTIFYLESQVKTIEKDKCTKQESTNISENITTEVDSSNLCCICAAKVRNFTPKYFLGNVLAPVCKICDVDKHDDPLSSFTPDGVPPSLVTHWNPSPSLEIQYHTSSFKSHVVDQYEDSLLQKELNMWKEVFKKELRRHAV